MTAPAVEKPSSAEELARTLGEAASAHRAVVPVGGGRASGMGNPLERCDVELNHLQHRLHGALCLEVIGIAEQLRQHGGDDLPGQAVSILKPAATIRPAAGR